MQPAVSPTRAKAKFAYSQCILSQSFPLQGEFNFY